MSTDMNIEEEKSSEDDKISSSRFRLGPAIVGWLIMNVLSLVALAIFLDKSMVYTMNIVTPVVFLIVGLIVGFWVSRLPTFELAAILVAGYVGPLVKMLKGTIFLYGWGTLLVSILLSVLLGFVGGQLGVMIKSKKISRTHST